MSCACLPRAPKASLPLRGQRAVRLMAARQMLTSISLAPDRMKARPGPKSPMRIFLFSQPVHHRHLLTAQKRLEFQGRDAETLPDLFRRAGHMQIRTSCLSENLEHSRQTENMI